MARCFAGLVSQVCPNPDCEKPLPMLADRYFRKLEGSLP
jgi:hypothetical protein